MYVSPNFKTKKDLKDALVAGKFVDVYSVSVFGDGVPLNGRVYLEGPHYPQPHRWYASADLKDGKIVALDGKAIKVKEPAAMPAI